MDRFRGEFAPGGGEARATIGEFLLELLDPIGHGTLHELPPTTPSHDTEGGSLRPATRLRLASPVESSVASADADAFHSVFDQAQPASRCREPGARLCDETGRGCAENGVASGRPGTGHDADATRR